MATSEPSPFLLSPIDNALPRNFVPHHLFFPLSPRSDVSAVINTLRKGLCKTIKSIHQLSGTVQPVGQKEELCVAGPWQTIDDILLVQDMRHDGGLEYHQLKSRHFPVKDLDPSLMPMAAILKPEKPVMTVKLNIIKGGIIMVLCLHHSYTDANGTIAIAKVWAAYCRGEDGAQLVTREMIDREPLMQGWGSATLDDLPGWGLQSTQERRPPKGVLIGIYNKIWASLTARFYQWTTMTKKPTPPQKETAVVFFPKEKLEQLKIMASSREQATDDKVWISTIDALCALVSCCTHSARDEKIRAKPGGTYSVVTVLGFRSKLPSILPAGFIGNALDIVVVSVPNQSMDATPANLAEVARLIRDGIKQRDERYIRNMIAALKSATDQGGRVFPITEIKSENQISFSSWANLSFYDLDWGDMVGTKVERVGFIGVCDLCVILPELRGPSFTDNERGLEVNITLEKDQMGRLKQNSFLNRFVEWRGN